jgi:hypothetical protein
MARFAQQGHMLAAGSSNHAQQQMFHVDLIWRADKPRTEAKTLYTFLPCL